jgi:hypothetical protein
MSTSLNIGQFFGSVSKRWAADSVVVNRLVHTQARALPSHAHQAAFVSLMLEGEYRETAGFSQFRYQPFSCIYHPPGVDHCDEIGQAGVTMLTLEFKPELFDAMDFATVNLRPIIDLSGRRATWELMDLYRRISSVSTSTRIFQSTLLWPGLRVPPVCILCIWDRFSARSLAKHWAST